MQLIFDNIVATIVGGTILMILVTVNQRNQMAAAEAASFYAQNKMSLDFTFTLQRDLQNVDNVLTINGSSGTFSFMAQTDTSSTTLHQIDYVRVVAGTRDGVPLYQIERYVDGAQHGGSMSTLTDWEIEARNAEGASIVAVADAQQVYVRYVATTAIVGVSADMPVKESRWEATFRPQLLQTDTL